MLFFDQIKREDPHLRLVAVTMLAGLATLLGGLWYVQVICAERYQETLHDQSVRTVRLPAVRGRIMDRNHVPLAENRASYNVDLYLAELSKQFHEHYLRIRPVGKLTRADREHWERVARYQVVSNIVLRLSSTLDQPRWLDERQFNRYYNEVRALPFTILKNLDPVQIACFVEKPPPIPGLELDIAPMRLYPHHALAAHLLGTLRRDDSSAEGEDSDFNYRLPDFKGLTGIELAFDQELRGHAGGKAMMVNRLGYRQSERLRSAPEPGQNVVLTIDRDIQSAAETALRTSSSGIETRAAAVVLDAQNGDVIAMASAPTYDPNMFLSRIKDEDWNALMHPVLKPQVNRAIQEHYQPGSIFKLIVALAGLEQGTLDPHEVIHNPGSYQLGKRNIRDLAPVGNYEFRKALAQSSNTYFITQGLRPGVLARIVALGQKLHLGERTEIMPRQETRGNFPDQRDITVGWHPGLTANLCIGQDRIDVTPLQMAVMTAAIANGGKVFWPRLAARLEPSEFGSTEPAREFPAGRVRDELGVNPANLAIIHDAMVADVEDPRGTGRAVWISGLKIGGKTGTAQIEQNGQMVDRTAWFVSFAPVEQPRWAVVVMVESGSSGGGTCAPIAKLIYQALLKRFPQDKNSVATAN